MSYTFGATPTGQFMLEGISSTATSPTFTGRYTTSLTVQATLVVPTGTASATVVIEVSNDLLGWINVGTISIDESALSDGFATTAKWCHWRARVTAFTATDSATTVNVSLAGV